MERVNNQAMLYFTRGDDLVTLNQAALYVLDNKQASRDRFHQRIEEFGGARVVL